jgi:hypothetical protein
VFVATSLLDACSCRMRCLAFRKLVRNFTSVHVMRDKIDRTALYVSLVK